MKTPALLFAVALSATATPSIVIIFTSDNGLRLSYGHHAGSAMPLRDGKGTAWEGGT